MIELSVVIPTFNRAAALRPLSRRTLPSVRTSRRVRDRRRRRRFDATRRPACSRRTRHRFASASSARRTPARRPRAIAASNGRPARTASSSTTTSSPSPTSSRSTCACSASARASSGSVRSASSSSRAPEASRGASPGGGRRTTGSSTTAPRPPTSGRATAETCPHPRRRCARSAASTRRSGGATTSSSRIGSSRAGSRSCTCRGRSASSTTARAFATSSATSTAPARQPCRSAIGHPELVRYAPLGDFAQGGKGLIVRRLMLAIRAPVWPLGLVDPLLRRAALDAPVPLPPALLLLAGRPPRARRPRGLGATHARYGHPDVPRHRSGRRTTEPVRHLQAAPPSAALLDPVSQAAGPDPGRVRRPPPAERAAAAGGRRAHVRRRLRRQRRDRPAPPATRVHSDHLPRDRARGGRQQMGRRGAARRPPAPLVAGREGPPGRGARDRRAQRLAPPAGRARRRRRRTGDRGRRRGDHLEPRVPAPRTSRTRSGAPRTRFGRSSPTRATTARAASSPARTGLPFRSTTFAAWRSPERVRSSALPSTSGSGARSWHRSEASPGDDLGRRRDTRPLGHLRALPPARSRRAHTERQRSSSSTRVPRESAE